MPGVRTFFINPVTMYGDEHIHMLTSVVDHFVPPTNKIRYKNMPGVCTYIFKSSHRIPNNYFYSYKWSLAYV